MLLGSVKDPKELARVADICKDKGFWRWVAAMKPFFVAVDEFRTWATGCACHEEDPPNLAPPYSHFHLLHPPPFPTLVYPLPMSRVGWDERSLFVRVGWRMLGGELFARVGWRRMAQ